MTKYQDTDNVDCKQRLRDFWYSDFMQEINKKPDLDTIEKLKQQYIATRTK